jgi:hypothetical protein
MDRIYRRYEILLPLKFNDGSAVPEELIAETVGDLKQHFGALSLETQRIEGLWPRHGEPHPDDLVRVFLDVPDTPENRQFFVEFKAMLKVRFQQDDIWVTTHKLEIL